METNLVLSYGTLKKGHPNHRVMQMAGGKYIADTTINGSMHSYGAFPVIDINTGSTIHCELYEVENLAPLDRLEGFPSFYFRSIVKTSCGRDAWVYHIPEGDKETLKRLPKIESGVWE
jgi:gamma-glutamylcyclotransferase (GGCT)/AIG2-like uncharacterized protein YtfP